MPVAKRIFTAFGARAERLRLVLFALAFFLFVVSLCGEAAAQTTPPALTPYPGTSLADLYGRMVYARNQELAAVSASSAGLKVAQSGNAVISDSASVLGKVAVNELRVIPLARIAARVATASAPIALAMLATDLISYGIQQCASSATGWCGPSAPPNSSDPNATGYCWYGQNGCLYGSGEAGCQSFPPPFSATWIGVVHNQYYECHWKRASDGADIINGSTQQGSTCASGYVLSGGKCVASTSGPQGPYTYPQLSDKLSQALSGNPDRSKDYWGIMSPADWYSALGESTTQAVPAQIVSPADGKVTGAKSTTTGPNGTTTTQSTYTVSPNNDAGSLANNPVTVTTTTTTTNPDGTTSTTTTTTTPGATGGGAPAKDPPTPCGLGTAGSPNCKMDESGTPTYSEPTTAKSKMDDADGRLKTKLDQIGQATPDQFGIGDVVKPLQGSCSAFSYALPKSSGVDAIDVDICPTIDATRDIVTWVWIVVSALVCILLVKDAINGG